MTKSKVLAALGAVLSALLCAAPARADSFRAEYQAEILGVVVVGRATLEGASANGRYSTTATLRTSGAAAIFDQTNITASASGSYGPRGVSWSGYNLSHAYARKFRRISMRRSGGQVRTTVTPRYGDMGNPAATPAQQQVSYDPVSALYVLGRLVGQARACTGSVRVFDGRGHYRLSLSPRSSGNYRGGGYNGAAVQCWMRYTPISGFNMTAEQRARIPIASAWYSRPAQPGFAIPLRISVPTPVGTAQLEIRSYRYTP